MTMKRILHCTLICLVLATSGCELFSSSDSGSPQKPTSQPPPQLENTINFIGAADQVRAAVEILKSPTRTGPTATVKAVKDKINDAVQKLGKEERDRCTGCTDETKSGAIQVAQNLIAISGTLGKDPQKRIVELEDVRTTSQENLTEQAGKLQELSTAKPKVIETPLTEAQAQKDPPKEIKSDSWWWGPLVLAGQILGGLLVLVVLAGALNYLWNRAWRTVEFNVSKVLKAHLAAARDAQPDYASRLSSLSSSQAEMSNKLAELNTEVRFLARLVRESQATRRSDGNSSYGGFNYQSQAEDVAPKDEPEFPVSVGDYLGKMNRYATVVRPDFQNGILVNDPDGAGELALIRDSRDDTQAFFVVPRAPQFQTKQDFYTYYQKYYDCVRPTAGDVWIIGPAVVEKVAGGWQLREKGMLEVR